MKCLSDYFLVRNAGTGSLLGLLCDLLLSTEYSYCILFQVYCVICCGRIQTKMFKAGVKMTAVFRSHLALMLLASFWIGMILT